LAQSLRFTVGGDGGIKFVWHHRSPLGDDGGASVSSLLGTNLRLNTSRSVGLFNLRQRAPFRKGRGYVWQ
ncbi:MAG: hypothetical protein WBE89_19355, partial [Methyloceanibacter sp.]